MDSNYVIIYKSPYTTYKKFNRFNEVTRYIIVNKLYEYTIFERMDGLREVENIIMESRIKDLENELESLKIDEREKSRFYNLLIKEKDKKIKELEKENRLLKSRR